MSIISHKYVCPHGGVSCTSMHVLASYLLRLPEVNNNMVTMVYATLQLVQTASAGWRGCASAAILHVVAAYVAGSGNICIEPIVTVQRQSDNNTNLMHIIMLPWLWYASRIVSMYYVAELTKAQDGDCQRHPQLLWHCLDGGLASDVRRTGISYQQWQQCDPAQQHVNTAVQQNCHQHQNLRHKNTAQQDPDIGAVAYSCALPRALAATCTSCAPPPEVHDTSQKLMQACALFSCSQEVYRQI